MRSSSSFAGRLCRTRLLSRDVVQAKAQAELDTAVGSKRLPSFNYRDSFPYINAV